MNQHILQFPSLSPELNCGAKYFADLFQKFRAVSCRRRMVMRAQIIQEIIHENLLTTFLHYNFVD